jgi:hypothetical protein
MPLPPRAAPVHKRKPVGRTASGRFIYLDRQTADRLAVEDRVLPRISDMPLDATVLIVDAGVPAFKVQHVGAALKARGARGYWLVQVQPRPRAASSGTLAETLIGFPGLHIARIGSTEEL